VNVRSSPSTDASVVATLADSTSARGEEFALTLPRKLSIPPTEGYGWFRISSPQAGWVYSKYVAGIGTTYSADCTEHDAIEQP
jgi:hypothetical protein